MSDEWDDDGSWDGTPRRHTVNRRGFCGRMECQIECVNLARDRVASLKAKRREMEAAQQAAATMEDATANALAAMKAAAAGQPSPDNPAQVPNLVATGWRSEAGRLGSVLGGLDETRQPAPGEIGQPAPGEMSATLVAGGPSAMESAEPIGARSASPAVPVTPSAPCVAPVTVSAPPATHSPHLRAELCHESDRPADEEPDQAAESATSSQAAEASP
jgi:hypothetical protein